MEKTPEEIKAEQEALEKQQKEERKKIKNETLRELSQEFEFNAFEPEEVKTKLKEFKEWQEAQKSEQQKLQEQLSSYEAKLAEVEKEKTNMALKFEATRLNINEEKLDKALKLADGDLSKLPEVVKEFPSLLKQKQEVRVNLRQKQEKQGDEVSPILAAFRKKHGIQK